MGVFPRGLDALAEEMIIRRGGQVVGADEVIVHLPEFFDGVDGADGFDGVEVGWLVGGGGGRGLFVVGFVGGFGGGWTGVVLVVVGVGGIHVGEGVGRLGF